MTGHQKLVVHAFHEAQMYRVHIHENQNFILDLPGTVITAHGKVVFAFEIFNVFQESEKTRGNFRSSSSSSGFIPQANKSLIAWSDVHSEVVTSTNMQVVFSFPKESKAIFDLAMFASE